MGLKCWCIVRARFSGSIEKADLCRAIEKHSLTKRYEFILKIIEHWLGVLCVFPATPSLYLIEIIHSLTLSPIQSHFAWHCF